MKKLMVILTNYAFENESYGLLGPQLAATIITQNTDYECVVIGIGHEYDRSTLKKYIFNMFSSQIPVIGFSHLGGRHDLWELAGELKSEGAITILGGPQADVDYTGEIEWEKYENRFRGVSENFNYALQGPAEQIIPLLKSVNKPDLNQTPGLIYRQDNKFLTNYRLRWDENYLSQVTWDNLYRSEKSEIRQIKVSLAQVIEQIGCPYAAKQASVYLDYPNFLNEQPFGKKGQIEIATKGCSFCDVARDKGFSGKLSREIVLKQISCLPEDENGRKIPFELINEQAIATLPHLLTAIKEQKIPISQINLVTRADWLYSQQEKLRDSLELAKSIEAKILLSQVGFESFSNTILKNLNKGYTIDINLKAINLIRQLKDKFYDTWYYATSDGAYHGFIHPTPWDSMETWREINTIISVYALTNDILPPHSTPLLIHHASALGDWARKLESIEKIQLQRAGSLIIW